MKFSNMFIIIFIFSNFVLAQSSLEEVYPILGDNTEGLIVRQSAEETFIIGASVDSIFTEVTISEQGKILHIKPFKNYNYKLINAIFTNDGGYLISIAQQNNGIQSFYLVKLNNSLVEEWSKFLFSYSDNNVHISLIQNSGNNILLSYIHENGSGLVLNYFNQFGNIIWQTLIEDIIFTYYGLRDYPLAEIDPNSFFVGTNNKLFKFNAQGDSIWSKDFISLNEITKTTDSSKFIVLYQSSLSLIDTDGNILLDHIDSASVTSTIAIFDDGSIFGFNDRRNYYNIINSSYKIDKTRKTKFQINNIGTDGDTFFGVGYYSPDYSYWLKDKKYLSFIRENKNTLPENFLSLLRPSNGSILPEDVFYLGNKLFIELNYHGIEALKIELSSDNGFSWQTLLIDSDPNKDFFTIDLPLLNSDECLIRTADTKNPIMKDESISPFSITYHRFVDSIATNEFKMRIGNRMTGYFTPGYTGSHSGLYWPGGKNATIIAGYKDAIHWAGLHQGLVKGNETRDRVALLQGAILENNLPDDPYKPEYSIFRLKRNWKHLPSGSERAYMEYNYENWPGQHGAPYNDLNNDGKYTKGVDTPRILGDETYFYVGNDLLNKEERDYCLTCSSVGIEFQITYFADTRDELKDVIFKKVKLINKSKSPIDSMFIAYWAWEELGNTEDNYAGCDTLLDLAYIYNRVNYNEDFYGESPPALGKLLLQGPITKGNGSDKAKFQERVINGYKNLGMTSFVVHLKRSIYEPAFTHEQSFNMMKGLNRYGDPIIDPFSGDTTNFMFDGNPVDGTGWIDGNSNHWFREFSLYSGPFTMAPGDTQEVVYAILMARGIDHIQSIVELKKSARYLHEFWGNDIPVSVNRNNNTVPTTFSLSQNYPNPFNPSTTIKYSIPQNTVILSGAKNLKDFSSPSSQLNRAPQNDSYNVSLIIYDILGRKVKTLVNKKQSPGNYEVEFNASKLASGIYFYQLRTADFVQVKKMIYLK